MRDRLLYVVLCLPLVLLHLLVEPFGQDQRYHDLADQRAWLGVPNFMDVASNLPFVALGLAGLASLARQPPGGRLSWAVFFGAVLLVGPGSAYYHWSPNDASLVWDRLPIACGLVVLLVALLSELKGRRFELPLLVGGLLVGAYSVLHWRLFDDLRLYLAVQLTPPLVVVYIAAAWRSPTLPPRYLASALALYLLARVAEALDGSIFGWTAQTVSGHTAKHLLAAGALYLLFLMKTRGPAAGAARQTG